MVMIITWVVQQVVFLMNCDQIIRETEDGDEEYINLK